MKLIWNSIGLQDYGQIVISSQTAAGKPEASPQWWEHQLKVRILFKQTTYSDNYALVQQVRAALKSQQEAVLEWQDDNGNELINQTATIIGHDRPESPNEKGTYYQSIEITFQYIESFTPKQAASVLATFQRTGTSTPLITLGNVESMKYTQDVRRYSEFRSHRASASGKIECRGRFVGDPSATLEDRRISLRAAADQMASEITNGSSGQFVFGSFDKTVRVESFFADYDQHINFIPWSITMIFTEFPDESGYAQAEFTVDTREDKKEGKLTMDLSGTIAAESEAHALAKLATIRASVASGFELLRSSHRAENVDGADGATFIKLTFDEEFEKLVGDLVEWELRVSDSDDVTAGMIRRTYSGHVTAKATLFTTAYQSAAAKAKSLGDSKHQFKLNGTLTCDDKQMSIPAERQTTGDVIVTVEFSYEYKLKSSRVYAEINSEFSGESFGLDTETVSGFIVAATADVARNLYTTIKSGYATYMMRNERVTETRQSIAKDVAARLGATNSPPDVPVNVTAGTAAVTVNSQEVDNSTPEPTPPLTRGPLNPTPITGHARLWNKLDFSFSIHRPKASGIYALRYEFTVAADFQSREKTSTVSGTIWALSEVSTEFFLTAWMDNYSSGLNLGNRINTRRSKSFDKYPASAGAKFASRGSDGSVFTAMTFEDTFVDQLDDSNQVIKSSIRETVKCSGTRNVIQPTAIDYDVLQQCGIQSGVRTISGSVTGTNESVCWSWINKMRALPLGSNFSIAGSTALQPPEFEIDTETIPLRELYPRTGTYGDAGSKTGNAKFVTISFTFAELCEQIAFLS